GGGRPRVVAGGREREAARLAPAAGAADRARASVEDEHGRLAALAAHLELAPVDPQPQPGAERLEASLLGGEARREVLGGVATALAIRDLAVREDAPQKTLLPALDDLTHPREMDEIHADAAHTGLAQRPGGGGVPGRVDRRGHGVPVGGRMIAARGSGRVPRAWP